MRVCLLWKTRLQRRPACRCAFLLLLCVAETPSKKQLLWQRMCNASGQSRIAVDSFIDISQNDLHDQCSCIVESLPSRSNGLHLVTQELFPPLLCQSSVDNTSILIYIWCSSGCRLLNTNQQPLSKAHTKVQTLKPRVTNAGRCDVAEGCQCPVKRAGGVQLHAGDIPDAAQRSTNGERTGCQPHRV